MADFQDKKEYIDRGVSIIKNSRAVLVRGNFNAIYEDLNDMIFDACGTNLDDTLHVDLFERESLSVDDARDIKEAASKVGRTSETMHVIVIAAQTLTREAQNSLLKVLEEPAETVALFIVTPHPERLLPTLVSRLATVNVKENIIGASEIKNPINQYAIEFVSLSVPDRLTLVQTILKEIEKGAFMKEDIATFCNTVKLQFDANSSGNVEYEQVVKAIEPIHSYLLDQSSSIKLLLEHMAMTLPKK